MLGEGEHLLSPSFGVTCASPEIPLMASVGSTLQFASPVGVQLGVVSGVCPEGSATPRPTHSFPLPDNSSATHTSIIHLFSPLLDANNNEEFEA